MANEELERWCKWAFESGVPPVIIAYIRYKPDKTLMNFVRLYKEAEATSIDEALHQD